MKIFISIVTLIVAVPVLYIVYIILMNFPIHEMQIQIAVAAVILCIVIIVGFGIMALFVSKVSEKLDIVSKKLDKIESSLDEKREVDAKDNEQ